MPSPGRILILDENLSFPFDKRVRREALALRQAGYTVSVICPKGEEFDTESREDFEGINVYRYTFWEAGSGFLAYVLEYLQALAMMSLLTMRVFSREGFDVVHLCNPPDLLFLVALPYKLLGRKIIFDHHDLCPELYQSQKEMTGTNLVHRVLKFCERLTFAAADVVIATNKSYEKVALQRGHKQAEDIFVVRNGPDLKRIAEVPEVPELRKGKENLVFYIGNMSKHDGVDYLLRAVAHLVQTRGRSDFHTIIIGGGQILDELKAYATELGIAEFVTITGRVSDEKVMQALSTCNVCVSPDPLNALNNVCTMQKTMEYMAMGKPVVAFDLVETRVSAQDAALYAKPNDEQEFGDLIARLFDEPELRQKIGAIGKQRVHETLSWEFSIPRLLDAYRRAFEKAGKGKKVPDSAGYNSN